ncbi:MAG: WhiB family transcriptional regulator [Nesterenkonia sp.]
MTSGWIEHARCATGVYGTDFFFPTTEPAEKAAQRFCAKCPVAAQCLELAMSTERGHARHGVFGGLTPDQRRQLYLTMRGQRPEQNSGQR